MEDSGTDLGERFKSREWSWGFLGGEKKLAGCSQQMDLF